MIKKIKGNIFNTSCQTLVNTVNCIGVMGKGIALECKLRFPPMFEKYKEYCEKKLIKPGSLQLWKESRPWILNFPTKLHWKDPSKIEYLEKGLEKFQKEYSNKKAKFQCKIISVKKPEEIKINDEFAKNLGAKDLSDLKILNDPRKRFLLQLYF